MLRRAVMVVALALAGLLTQTSTGSACHRFCCQPCCYVPCCPCEPCHCVWCWGAYWDCCSCQWKWCYVHCHCGPHHIPGWCFGYIPQYCRYGSVYVYHCYYDYKGEGPPPAGTPATGGEKKTGQIDTPFATATLVVELPADAVLRIEGQTMTTTSSVREFVTPSLQAGQDYVYTLEAEFATASGPQRVKKEVTVRAGEMTRASFLPTAVSASR